jgi:hypothetical protein
MRCILGDQCRHVRCRDLLREIHAGMCGHHAGPRKLVEKTSRQGFYWPTVVATPRRLYAIVRGASSTLDKLISRCKRFEPSPSNGLSLWHLDMVGPL